MKVVKEEIITKVIRDDGREFELHQEVDGGIVVGFQIARDCGIHLMLWDGKEGWTLSIDKID